MGSFKTCIDLFATNKTISIHLSLSHHVILCILSTSLYHGFSRGNVAFNSATLPAVCRNDLMAGVVFASDVWGPSGLCKKV